MLNFNKPNLLANISLAFVLLISTPFAMAGDQQKRDIAQTNLIYLELDTGLVLIELAPFMAPKVATQFKQLVKSGYYNGLDFYRVIDGFVAQAGDHKETRENKWNKVIEDELYRKVTKDSDFYSIQNPGLMGRDEGYINGFSAARDVSKKQEWLLHCYGAVALARNMKINTGNSHFYITIGHAPRMLDRNLTVFGRVVYGMDKVQKIQRPPFGSDGIIEKESQRTRIISARAGEDVAVENQIHLTEQTVTSVAFQKRLNSAKTRESDFFVEKGDGKVDVCYYRPAIELKQQE